MYHKVNDLPGNPLTMPVSIFDEQMDQLRDLDYTVVGLDAVLDHYVEGKSLPERAVLITFDDGYYDNLDNAAGVLRKYGYPAVLFVPIGYLDDRHPLPHEEHLAAQGILNRTIEWARARRPGAGGDPHRVARHLAIVRSRISRSTRRRARSLSRSFGWRNGSAGRCARSRTSRARRRTTSPSTSRSCARPATTSRSPRSRAPTHRRRIRCSCAATTSSPTPRARSSSCWRERAT